MTRRKPTTLLWEPSAAFAQRTRLRAYMDWLAAYHGVEVDGYDELWRWSVGDLEGFWSSIAEYFDVRFHDAAERGARATREMPGARWFAGATLSYPEHIFRGRDDDAVAIRHASELRPLEEMTWGAAARARPRASRPGCARSASAPATASRRTCRTSPRRSRRFSPRPASARSGRAARRTSARARSSTASRRSSRRCCSRSTATATAGATTTAARSSRRSTRRSAGTLVRLGYLDGGGWEDGFLGEAGATLELELAPVAFDHPLWVLYSSGTTGLPKAIVHGHGGILLEQLKHQNLHLDMHADDRAFWFTTTGWMMWNFLVGVLLTPASIVLYDGSPAAPTLDRLWELAAEAGITCFGTSAAFIAGCMKARRAPAGARRARPRRAAQRRLDRLAAVAGGLSLGLRRARRRHVAVLDERRDRRLHGVRRRRAAAARLRGRAAGALAGLRRAGLRRATARRSSTRSASSSSPSRCRRCRCAFWNDPDGERLREAYFEMYPGVWRHGDWIEITSRGTAVIYGRSDSTINRGGVRMGTSEIYRAVLALDEIVDALVVDVDGWMALFVVLRDGAALDDDAARARSRGASARTARRATCPTTSTPSPRSRARCRASCSRCRSSGSSPARRPEQRGQPRLAGQPGGAGLVRRVRARRGRRRGVSKSRAKKKQRQRARAASGAHGAARAGGAAPRRASPRGDAAPPLAPRGPRRRAAPRRDLGAVSAHRDRHGASGS